MSAGRWPRLRTYSAVVEGSEWPTWRDVGEVEAAVGVQGSDDRSAATVAGETFGVDAGDLGCSADFLRDGLAVRETAVDCGEHHRQLLAVVDVLAPIGTHRLALELLRGSTLAKVCDRVRREVVDTLGP